MRQTIFAAFLFLLTFSCTDTAMGQTKNTEVNIDQLIEQMTLEEKVGQMLQLTLDLLLEGEAYAPAVPFRMEEAKMKKAIIDYKAGSILNVPTGQLPDPQQWQEIISAIQEMAGTTRLGIPILYGIDAIHGVNYSKGSTLFPQPLAQAASWNLNLSHQMAEVTAYEARAVGLPWNFSPAMDVGRNPEWPRLWESFGEDVLVNSLFGEVTVKGYQGEDPSARDKVAACLKHFTGYGMPFSGKDRTPAYIPENYLREIYLPPYQRCIDAGALSIMVNSGEINGIPVHANKELLTDILRNEMGFKGLLVTDWSDIVYLNTRHKTAPTMKEAVRQAIEAGIDMSMAPTDYEFADLLIELVKEGTISEERINESVRRILRVKKELGLFENTHEPFNTFPEYGSQASTALSLKAAQESIVLLKNENEVLPLSTSTKVLITGPSAKSMRSLNGGWTYDWQGTLADSLMDDKMTILEAVESKIGAENLTFQLGADFEAPANMQDAVFAAQEADVILLCLGEDSYTEDFGNLNDLELPEPQRELALAMAATGKPIVLILTEGRPRIISPFVDACQAVMGAFYPGPEGGRAIADVLFGDYNPSGKLPFTYPQYSNSLMTYDHKWTENRDVGRSGLSFNPQFEFGHGLSYTTFEYIDLELSQSTYSKNETIQLSVKVSNTGNRSGALPVLVYVRDEFASITPSVKRLRAFTKIELTAGASKTVKIEIPVKDLAFINAQQKWVVEPGQFTLMVGGLEQTFTVSDE